MDQKKSGRKRLLGTSHNNSSLLTFSEEAYWDGQWPDFCGRNWLLGTRIDFLGTKFLFANNYFSCSAHQETNYYKLKNGIDKTW